MRVARSTQVKVVGILAIAAVAFVNRPSAGAVIVGSGGLRKLRWATKGKGKRGGARVIYYWVVTQTQLLMLLISEISRERFSVAYRPDAFWSETRSIGWKSVRSLTAGQWSKWAALKMSVSTAKATGKTDTLISLRHIRLASIRSTIWAKMSVKSAKMPSEYLPIRPPEKGLREISVTRGQLKTLKKIVEEEYP